MGTGTTNGLLDELLEKRVLNQEEMEKIRVENVTAKDKARALLSSVIPKGPEACQICINHICENDYHLAGLLGLSSGKDERPRAHTCLCLCAQHLTALWVTFICRNLPYASFLGSSFQCECCPTILFVYVLFMSMSFFWLKLNFYPDYGVIPLLKSIRTA